MWAVIRWSRELTFEAISHFSKLNKNPFTPRSKLIKSRRQLSKTIIQALFFIYVLTFDHVFRFTCFTTLAFEF